MVALKPYPEYKDSGVPWLGEIPKHWECSPLRRVAQVQLSNVDKHTVDGEIPVRLCNYTDVYYHRFITPSIEFMKASALPREIKKFELRRGDVLITKDSESWMDIAVPAYVTSDLPGVLCGYHLAQLRPYFEILRGEYLLRAFQAEPLAYQFRVAANGVTRFALSGTDIAAGLFPIPPQAEQDIITIFLAYADHRINRLIRTKRRLIELLNEQKQAVIHRAVTRGLDTNVRLKPSGIDWLGDIPAHWEVVGLRMRYSVQLGKMLDAKRITGSYLVPYLRNTDVQWDRVNTSDLPMMDIREDEYPRYTVQPGDLLVCEGGEVGRAAFWEGSLPICGYQKALHRIRPTHGSRDFPRFLFYVLFSVSKRGVFVANGSENTIAHLTAEKLRRYRFAFPPRDEQETIANHLDVTLADLDRAIEKATREIDLLREYRTRLIADVVTGKLDVRGVELPGLDVSETLHDLGSDEETPLEEMEPAEETADVDTW